MNLRDIGRRPRALGIACAIGAVALGLAYLTLAGAPLSYLAVNAGALVTGLAVVALFRLGAPARALPKGAGIVAMAGGLLATALMGETIEGAARWVTLGGLTVQPSLILLPAMLVGYARGRNAVATVGIVLAAAAMAIQPDRAMAGMLALGLAVLLMQQPNRQVAVACAAGVIGFAATLVRADTLPAVPYVDQILYSSFEVHALAGAAVLAGSALLLLPAIVGGGQVAADRAPYLVFGALWLGAILAAALGNYPTPVVGYGGSAILGYLLSLLALPRSAGRRAGTASHSDSSANGASPDGPLSLTPAQIGFRPT